MKIKNVRLIIIMLFMIITLLFQQTQNTKAIDNSRNDLGILDSLKIEDQFGSIINTDGAEMRKGYLYSLRYEWSLDDPASDYQNQVATFDLPSVFDYTTVTPTSIPLNYDDNGTPVEIGTVSINTTNGTVTIAFNNSSILATKSNIHGYLSLAANCGSTLGPADITIGWNGNTEETISINVIDPGIGENRPASLNKFVTSGMLGGQPIVQQDANGKFYINFRVEVLISNNHPELSITDTVYAGLQVDMSSVQVISRPRDGSVYFLPDPNTYRDNYDLWQLTNPTGPLSTNNNVTTDLQNSNSINASDAGFKINLGSVDFDSQLASRQLTTTPLQMRYRVDYKTFLTGVDPNATLAEAQAMFESQDAKNVISLTQNGTLVTETTWNKGILGGGAEGEVRGVTLNKVDKDTRAPLTGAVFNLYKQNAYNSYLWETYRVNITMTSSSILVDNLTFGNYRFVEIKSPGGYLLPTNPFSPFTIDSNTPLTNFQITLENSRPSGALQFEKVDSKNSSIKLSATFSIYQASNDSFVKTVTTGKDGKGEVLNLTIGKYYLVETIAPKNYKLNKTHYPFTIEQDVTNKFYVGANAIKNIKIDTSIIDTLPKTGDNSIVIGLSILFLGIGITLLRVDIIKKNKS